MNTHTYKDNCQNCAYCKGRIGLSKIDCRHPYKKIVGYMILTFDKCPFLGKETPIIPADKPMDILNINPNRETLEKIILEPEVIRCWECFMWSEIKGHCLYSENLTDRNDNCTKGRRK